MLLNTNEKYNLIVKSIGLPRAIFEGCWVATRGTAVFLEHSDFIPIHLSIIAIALKLQLPLIYFTFISATAPKS